MGIYERNCMRTVGLRRIIIATKYVQEKGYRELLVLLSMLFVHLLIQTREYNFSIQVYVETVFR